MPRMARLTIVAATILKRSFARFLLVAALVLAVAAPPATAAPDKKLGASGLASCGKQCSRHRRALRTHSLKTAMSFASISVGGSSRRSTGSEKDPITCTVKPGTRIFVAAWTAECSTVEDDPFFGSNEAELRACAQAVNAGISTRDVIVVLDGGRVPVSEVTSGLLRLDLPADNIFGAAAGTGPPGMPYLSVADGWVALLHPLTPGTHTITLKITGEFPPGTPLEHQQHNHDHRSARRLVRPPGREV